MAREILLTVTQVARLSKVSVRTLHHYDQIGLLRPSGRSGAGYRLYGEADLERLQQVLFFRELGFSLDDIARMTGDPAFDVRAALRMQRQLLAEKAVRVSELIAAVDAAMERLDQGGTMSDDRAIAQMFEGFDPSVYEEEAKERWGDTEAYQESKRRTARYTKRDWDVIKAEAEAAYGRLAELLDAGAPPTSTEAMDAAEAHRLHIERWFYPCPPALHRGLGQLYTDDPRFTSNLDKARPGLARYACEAFRANAARAHVGSGA